MKKEKQNRFMTKEAGFSGNDGNEVAGEEFQKKIYYDTNRASRSNYPLRIDLFNLQPYQ